MVYLGAFKLTKGANQHSTCPPIGSAGVTLTENSASRPHGKLRIQNVIITALFDTGSTVSLISGRVFDKLWPKPLMKKIDAQVRAAQGTKMMVRGIINVKITARDDSFKMNRPIFVVDNLSSECIIGMDTITAEGIEIDIKNRRISYPRRSQSVESFSVFVHKQTTVLPWEERIVYGTCETLLGPDECFMIHENENPPFCSAEIVYGRNDKIPIVVANPTEWPVELKRGQILATGQKIKNEQLVAFDQVHAVEMKVSRLHKSHIPLEILKNIPKEWVDKYQDMLARFPSIFSVNPDDVGHCKEFPQKILLKDNKMIANTPPYRIPHHLLEVAHSYIHKLLKAGIIRPSTSPFSSPLLLVRKPGVNDPTKSLVEQFRVVHDYRLLNTNIIPDSYPLYHIYDLIDRVAQAKIWSVIDLSSGFFNQNLEETSRKYTAFGLPGMGHYEYTRSAQGLCNSPASFQRMLDGVIKGLDNCFVYIDDVVVASNSHEEHIKDLSNVFERFQRYNIKCRLGKLQLGSPQVTYLGYDISRKDGIRPGMIKSKVIRDWPPPADVRQVRQFLGLCSFFRRTIQEYASIASPLTRLTRKDASWKSGPLPEAALKAFLILQDKLSRRPCLSPVDFQREFILTTDASTVGLGAILSQIDAGGIERPCAYASRVLKDAEMKLAPFHLEHLAMLWGCKHFHPYLVGKHFTIRTDHKPLMTLNKVQGQALDRIRADLLEFGPFTVKYIKGEQMPADGLSRLVLPDNAQVCDIKGNEKLMTDVTPEKLNYLQRGDKEIKAVACLIKYDILPSDPKLRQLVNSLRDQIWMKDSLVMVRHQIYAPFSIRHTLLHLAHDDPRSGHFGVDRTLHALRQTWFWPGMSADVQTHIGQCTTCLAVNTPKAYINAPLGSLPEATHFNQRIHLDLLGPLPATMVHKYKYILLITDAFSHWVELVPIESKEAVVVAEAFHSQWICRFSCPDSVNSDQGKEFTAKVFASLLTRYNILHNLSSVMHPQSNGIAERFNRTMVTYLRKYLTSGPCWDKALPMLQSSYNNSPHASTKTSPYQLVVGRIPKYPSDMFVVKPDTFYGTDEGEIMYRNLSRLHTEVLQNQREAFSRQKVEHDKRIKGVEIITGDIVFITRPHSGAMFQKFQQPFMGPYRVLQVSEKYNVHLQDCKTFKQIQVHLNRVKLAPFLRQHFELSDPIGKTIQIEKPVRDIIPKMIDRKAPMTTPFVNTDEDESGVVVIPLVPQVPPVIPLPHVLPEEPPPPEPDDEGHPPLVVPEEVRPLGMLEDPEVRTGAIPKVPGRGRGRGRGKAKPNVVPPGEPGALTRTMLRAIGVKPPEPVLPARPLEYKETKKKK